MKRILWILVTPLSVLFLLGALNHYYVTPAIERLILEQLHTYSAENLPVTLQAEQVSVSLLKPSLSLLKLKAQPNANDTFNMPTLEVSEVRAHLDVFKLITGNLLLSAVIIDGLKTSVNIDPFLTKKSDDKPLPLNELFDILEQIPVARLGLVNVQAQVHSEKLGFQAETANGDLFLSNLNKKASLRIQFPDLSVELKKIGQFSGGVSTAVTLDRQTLRVNEFALKLGDSEFTAYGTMSEFATIANKLRADFDFHASINITDVYEEYKKLTPESKLPKLTGLLTGEGEVKIDGFNKISLKSDLNTKSITMGSLIFGDAQLSGEYRNRTISLSKVQVIHPAGKTELLKTQLLLDDNFNFHSQVNVESLDLHKLFQTINLPSIPVGLQLSANLPCRGRIKPDFLLSCDGVQLKGQDLWIKTDLKQGTRDLFNIDTLGAQGRFSITNKSVYYNAQVSFADSVGTSEGEIDFKKGFNIKFNSPRLDFKNIRNLANLRFVGESAVQGFTSGDSTSAIFDMKFNAKNLTFDNFYLGNISTLLKYRQGVMHFEDIQGAVNTSQYLGSLDVNLNNDSLRGAFSLPTLDLADVKTIIKDFYLLPFSTSGSGSARAKVSGPLNFWKLNYDLQGSFRNVYLGPEIFEKLELDLEATEGNLNFKTAKLQRGAGQVTVKGGISSDQELNILLDGRNWRLEESNFIGQLSSGITGLVYFASAVTGTVEQPQVELQGTIKETLFDEKDVADSRFKMMVTKQDVRGELDLFGSKVKSDFLLPLIDNRALNLKVQAQDWDYSTALALVGGTNLANEYQSTISGAVDLKSDTGSLLKSTGKIHIERFHLTRGELNFTNPAPIELVVNAGNVVIKNFMLKGPETSLQIRGNDFNADRLGLTVLGKVDLRLLQIFTPFLDELGGPFKLSARVTGSLTSPHIVGTANGSNLFVKLKGFPHPLEKINTDITFSENRIILNSLKGQLAGGSAQAEGSIQLLGPDNYPINIRANLENVSLNVPDQVRTTGNGDLLFSGRKLPYLLSGTYQVQSANVTKEFTEDSSGAIGVKQSRYLPRFIHETHSAPIVLDINIALNRNIFVKNSLMDGSIVGQLQVKGPPENPVLFGKISTERKAKVIFKDKVFDVQSGIIEFNDPNEINPVLYISANSHINDYDVTLIAQGPAKNLSITLSSIPPLPEQDIISLIALGVTSSALEQNTQSRQQAEQLGAEIGGAVLAKPINKQLESTLGLNLAVTSDYDSTRNISVPKITLSRKLSDKIKVSGSRPVGDGQSYDLKLEYLLNSNITAIGSFETKGASEEANSTQPTKKESQSIFGLDLEFKREFK